MAVPSLAIPNALIPSINSRTKRQTDPEPNTCTDICTPDPDCIEICTSDSPPTGRLCNNVCIYNGLTINAGGNFCLNAGANAAQNDPRSGVGVMLRGTSISAAGDININIVDRSSNGLIVLYVEDVALNAGGRIRINFGDGPRCIGDNCRVLVQARNVRWRSALTGGEERRAIEQVYYSELDGSLIWQ
ncbi:hypothetical protein HFD88_005243 [Aspergillus terreus]|nr:hypothetical protein HFD88_005243 [Aspergillus terreus]